MGCVVEQDGAQDGLLRIEIRGQAGLKREVGDGGHISRNPKNASALIRGRSSEFDWSGDGEQAPFRPSLGRPRCVTRAIVWKPWKCSPVPDGPAKNPSYCALKRA